MFQLFQVLSYFLATLSDALYGEAFCGRRGWSNLHRYPSFMPRHVAALEQSRIVFVTKHTNTSILNKHTKHDVVVLLYTKQRNHALAS